MDHCRNIVVVPSVVVEMSEVASRQDTRRSTLEEEVVDVLIVNSVLLICKSCEDTCEETRVERLASLVLIVALWLIEASR